MAIETVLLLVILVSSFLFLTKYIRDRNMVANLVSKPIQNVANMTAFGTWRSDGCTAPGRSKQTIGKCHPNSAARSLSSNPNPDAAP
jgi:hypothetical protein